MRRNASQIVIYSGFYFNKNTRDSIAKKRLPVLPGMSSEKRGKLPEKRKSHRKRGKASEKRESCRKSGKAIGKARKAIGKGTGNVRKVAICSRIKKAAARYFRLRLLHDLCSFRTGYSVFQNRLWIYSVRAFRLYKFSGAEM